MGFVPLKKESPKTQQLRDIATNLGIQGAQPVDAFEFLSKASTTDRNAAMQNLQGFDINSAKVRIDEAELNKRIADTLRTSGPATFRNLRDVFGADVVDELKPTAKPLKKNEFVTTGNQNAGDLVGFRKSLEQSLKPQTQEQSLRTSAVKQVQKDTFTNKRDELADSIARQQQEFLAGNQPQQPNILEKIASVVGSGGPLGIGGKFLSNLFNKPAQEVSTPITSVTSPDTGEVIDFNQEESNPQIKQLQDEAALAISQGADPEQVKAQLAQLIQQLKGVVK